MPGSGTGTPISTPLITPEYLANKATFLYDCKIDLTKQANIDLVIQGVNDFQNDVAKLLPPLTPIDLNVTADTWTELPAGLISIESVELSGDDYAGTWQIRETQPRQIKFPEAGTYTIFYKAVPNKHYDVDSQEVDCHPLLAELGSLYLASLWKAKREDNKADSDRLMGQYLQDRNNAVNRIANPTGQPRKIKNVYGGGW